MVEFGEDWYVSNDRYSRNQKKLTPSLPHALVDRVLEVSEDTIVAIKNVTINEPLFNGHFPQYPVMPGVLIMEALAQTAGVLELSKPENKGNWSSMLAWTRLSLSKVVPGDH